MTELHLWHMGSSIFIAAAELPSCSIWDLVPWPGIESGPPALGARNFGHEGSPPGLYFNPSVVLYSYVCPLLLHRTLHFWRSGHKMWRGFPHTSNLTHFWHSAPGDSVRSYKVKDSVLQVPSLPLQMPIESSYASVLLTQWLQIRGSHSVIFGFN